jgi:hypothetical protein
MQTAVEPVVVDKILTGLCQCSSDNKKALN